MPDYFQVARFLHTRKDFSFILSTSFSSALFKINFVLTYAEANL